MVLKNILKDKGRKGIIGGLMVTFIAIIVIAIILFGYVLFSFAMKTFSPYRYGVENKYSETNIGPYFYKYGGEPGMLNKGSFQYSYSIFKDIRENGNEIMQKRTEIVLDSNYNTNEIIEVYSK